MQLSVEVTGLDGKKIASATVMENGTTVVTYPCGTCKMQDLQMLCLDLLKNQSEIHLTVRQKVVR